MKAWGLLILFLSFSAQVLAADECGSLGAAPGEYLVRWKSIPAPQILSAKTTAAYKVKKWIHADQAKGFFAKALSQIETTAPLSLHENLRIADVEELKSDSNILSVEPNCYRELALKPNDTYFDSQWGLQAIGAPAAWDRSTGKSTIIVGVSDTGIDYTHEDLREQMWVNTVEMNGSFGIDDDGNGCIDDIYGCDLAMHDGDPMPSGGDAMSFHGTHVAGIIGAKPNNGKGIAGVAWNVKLIAAKGFADQTMNGTLANLLDSIYYSANNGARIINCSWGGPGQPSQAERDAIRYARNKGILVVVAAGNDGKDASTYTPASIAEALTVGAVNKKSQYSTFSNYGYSLDLLAPGGDIANGSMTDYIYSTYPGNTYRGEVGTSMAAPFVTGVAALVLSINSALSLSQLEGILIQSATPVTLTHPNNPGQSYSHLIVNAKRAADLALATLPAEERNNNNICNPSQDQNCGLDLSSQVGGGAGQAKMGGCGQVSSVPPTSSNSNGALLFLILSLPLFVLYHLRGSKVF